MPKSHLVSTRKKYSYKKSVQIDFKSEYIEKCF